MLKQSGIKTSRVVTVITQPVLHTHAKPDVIVNHSQRTLPEIQALCQSANAIHTLMASNKEFKNRFLENQNNNTQRKNEHQPAHEQHLTAPYRERKYNESCNSDSGPCPPRLAQEKHHEQRHIDCDRAN